MALVNDNGEVEAMITDKSYSQKLQETHSNLSIYTTDDLTNLTSLKEKKDDSETSS